MWSSSEVLSWYSLVFMYYHMYTCKKKKNIKLYNFIIYLYSERTYRQKMGCCVCVFASAASNTTTTTTDNDVTVSSYSYL